MRKKMGLRGALFLTAFCALFLGAGGTARAQETTLQIESVRGEGKNIICYVNHDGAEGFAPKAEESGAKLEGTSCPVSEIVSFADTGEGRIYDCIVDVSGSMDEERMERIKGILGQILEGKGEKDLIRITRMGNERYSSAFLQDEASVREQIDLLAVTKEDTNLYASICEELKELKAEETQGQRCLLLFSDGAEDQAGGVTREEAESAVKESGIAVFTVAMLKEEPSAQELESAKILGSFARLSLSGKDYNPEVDGVSYDEISDGVREALDKSLRVTVDLEGAETQSETPTLSLTLSGGGSEGYAEWKLSPDLVKALDIEKKEPPESVSYVKIQTDDTPAEADGAQTKESAAQDKESGLLGRLGGKTLLLAGIVIMTAVLLLLLLLLLCGGRRTKEEQDEETQEKDRFEGERLEEEPQEIWISLINQNSGQEYTAALRGRLIIGRGTECEIPIPEDGALSKQHAYLLKEQDGIFLMDAGSSNGSYVNGVLALGKQRLEQGDILLLGSAEYRLTWG